MALPVPAWAAAACRGTDPEDWYAAPTDTTTIMFCKRICRRCYIRPDCLTHALTTGEIYGIWGGKTPNERAAIRKYRNRVAHTATSGPAALKAA